MTYYYYKGTIRLNRRKTCSSVVAFNKPGVLNWEYLLKRRRHCCKVSITFKNSRIIFCFMEWNTHYVEWRMYIFCSPCQWKINKHQKTYSNYLIIASVYSRSIIPDLRDYINETYFSRLVHDQTMVLKT